MSIDPLQNKTLMQSQLLSVFHNDREKIVGNRKTRDSFQLIKTADESELILIEAKDKSSNVSTSANQLKRVSHSSYRRSTRKGINIQESYLGNNIDIEG